MRILIIYRLYITIVLTAIKCTCVVGWINGMSSLVGLLNAEINSTITVLNYI